MQQSTDIGRYPVGLKLFWLFFGMGVMIAFFHLIGIKPVFQIRL